MLIRSTIIPNKSLVAVRDVTHFDLLYNQHFTLSSQNNNNRALLGENMQKLKMKKR